jgi:TBC1 domain family member 2
MSATRTPLSRAIPPPARPHIGLNPNFSSFTTSEWAEEDAWDSGSDSESPHRTSISSSWNKPVNKPNTAPKPVPKHARNSSSSTLAFSYTDVQVPSPSSYPSPPESLQPQSSKNGWTLVTKSTASQDTQGEYRLGDPDYAESIIAGVVDLEGVDDLELPTLNVSRQDHGSLRPEIDEIVNGTSSASPDLCECPH